MKYFNLVLIAIFFFGCERQSDSVILISKDSDQRIEKWFHQIDTTLNIREFYSIPSDSMNYFLNLASGIVIGGGEDIHPSIYGKEEFVEVCGAFDLFRDSIELVLINYAMKEKLPLLGICRGQQILNAANGGTLIPDIPSFLETKINHRSDSDSAHAVILTKNSCLQNVLNCDTIWVNSRHHQCVDKVAPGFIVSAISPDGVIESIELTDSLQNNFTVGVQWHPESLLDESSMKIARFFLTKVSTIY